MKEKLSQGAQKKRYEDCLNQSLGIWFCCETCETLALDLPTWRRKINEVAVLFEKKSRSSEETSAVQAQSHLLAICPRNSPVSRMRQSSPHPYWIDQPQLHTAPVLSPRAIVDRNWWTTTYSSVKTIWGGLDWSYSGIRIGRYCDSFKGYW